MSPVVSIARLLQSKTASSTGPTPSATKRKLASGACRKRIKIGEPHRSKSDQKRADLDRSISDERAKRGDRATPRSDDPRPRGDARAQPFYLFVVNPTHSLKRTIWRRFFSFVHRTTVKRYCKRPPPMRVTRYPATKLDANALTLVVVLAVGIGGDGRCDSEAIPLGLCAIAL
jgi:hypothetical protein